MSESWFPTRGGTYTAYEPEYEDKNGNWHRVPTVDLPEPYSSLGVPQPRYCGGISHEIGLFGRAQAWALAWAYAASAEATGKEIKVRVAQYDVRYDIKAKRLEMPLSTGE